MQVFQARVVYAFEKRLFNGNNPEVHPKTRKRESHCVFDHKQS